MTDPLRAAAQTLAYFAGRFSAGDIDIDRSDLQVAIEEVLALAADTARPNGLWLSMEELADISTPASSTVPWTEETQRVIQKRLGAICRRVAADRPESLRRRLRRESIERDRAALAEYARPGHTFEPMRDANDTTCSRCLRVHPLTAARPGLDLGPMCRGNTPDGPCDDEMCEGHARPGLDVEAQTEVVHRALLMLLQREPKAMAATQFIRWLEQDGYTVARLTEKRP